MSSDNVCNTSVGGLEYVYTTATGRLYYPKPSKMAPARIKRIDAEAKGLTPSASYRKMFKTA